MTSAYLTVGVRTLVLALCLWVFHGCSESGNIAVPGPAASAPSFAQARSALVACGAGVQCPSASVCTGKASNWQVYASNSLFVEVDTSACGFAEPPYYFARLQGDSEVNGQPAAGSLESVLGGGTAIYSPTETGFYVYLAGESITPQEAIDSNWVLNWQGVRKNSNRCAGRVGGWTGEGTRASLTVNTSECGFDDSDSPTYVTSLGGDGYQKRAMGATVITEPTKDGFSVKLYYPNATPNGISAAAFANSLDWQLNWQALPASTSDCVGHETVGWQQDGFDVIEGYVDTSWCDLSDASPILTGLTHQGGTPEIVRGLPVVQQEADGFWVRLRNATGLGAAYAYNSGWKVTWTAAGSTPVDCSTVPGCTGFCPCEEGRQCSTDSQCGEGRVCGAGGNDLTSNSAAHFTPGATGNACWAGPDVCPGESGVSCGFPGAPCGSCEPLESCKAGSEVQCPSDNSCTGKTSPEDWRYYNSNTLFVDVDTTDCDFDSDEIPHYFSSLQGDLEVDGQQTSGVLESILGSTAIYSPTKDGFRVYVGGGATTLKKAREANWHLNWQAIERDSQDDNRCAGASTGVWEQIGGNSAFLEVDTSRCNLDATPTYVTSFEGSYKAMGMSVTTVPTSNGFRVNVYYPFARPPESPTTAELANTANWRVNWQALPSTSLECVGEAEVDWEQDGPHAIRGFVDTTSCELSEHSPILTAMTAQSGNPWQARGIPVAQQEAGGFTVRMHNSAGLSAETANNANWKVTWTAAGAKKRIVDCALETECSASCPCEGNCTAGPCKLAGSECAQDSDCIPGLLCGSNNGGCFGLGRSKNVCWPAECTGGFDATQCGQENSLCGSVCDCAQACDPSADNPDAVCPAGESCIEGLGLQTNKSVDHVCGDAGVTCPTDDPEHCGSPTATCGEQCVPQPNCETATCENSADGIGGICPGLCAPEEPCSHDLECGPAFGCIQGACRPQSCVGRVFGPGECGPGLECPCPVCTPDCDNRQCGIDPNCGTSCGGPCSGSEFCDAEGQCVAVLESHEILVPDGSGGQEALECAESPDAPSTVGAVPGQFSVSEAGTAQYAVPIEVPPGRAGMQPALSLKYTGGKRDGLVGAGWRLDGLSQITRCPRTFARNGVAAGVKNSPEDMYCFDGKPLALISGTYGGDGAEYRTWVDSFAKVVSYRMANGGFQPEPRAGVEIVPHDEQGADYFKVWTKEGRILTYGKTRSSLVQAANGVRVSWLIQRAEDRVGNNILYLYTNSATLHNDALQTQIVHSTSLHRIDYTGHGDTSGTRSVYFRYEPRDDQLLQIRQGGTPYISSQRLSAVETRLYGKAVKSYHLKYGALQAPTVGQGASQVESITECAGTGLLDVQQPGLLDMTRCKSPTQFTYEYRPGFAFGATDQKLGDLANHIQVDLNGDGIVDHHRTSRTTETETDYAYFIARAAGDVVVAVASAYTGGIGGVVVSAVWKGFQHLLGPHQPRRRVVTESRAALATGSRQGLVQRVHGRVFSCEWVDTASGQEASDPFNDCDEGQEPVWEDLASPLRECEVYGPLAVFDYDRDGKEDIVSVCGERVGGGTPKRDVRWTLYPHLSDGTGDLIGGIVVPIGTSSNGTPPVIYDVNGDGLRDIVYCDDELMTLRLRRPVFSDNSQGSTFWSDDIPSTGYQFGSICGRSRPTYALIDHDGDGVVELRHFEVLAPRMGARSQYILRYSGQELYWEEQPAVSTGFASQGIALQSNQYLRQADFNGDGLADFYGDYDDQAVMWLNLGNGRFEPRLMARPGSALAGLSVQRAPPTVIDYTGSGRAGLLESWYETGHPLSRPENVVVLGNLSTGLKAYLEPTVFETVTHTSRKETQCQFIDLPQFENNDESNNTNNGDPKYPPCGPDMEEVVVEVTLDPPIVQDVDRDWVGAVDIDGDGATDLLRPASATGVFYGQSKLNGLLKTVTDGLGNHVSVEYDGASPETGEGPVDTAYEMTDYCHEDVQWPRVCIPRLHGLVSAHVVHGDGIPERRYEYRYYDALVDRAGHGFLGFSKREVVDHSLNRTMTTEYWPPEEYADGTSEQYYYPLAGLPLTVSVDDHVGPPSELPAIPVEFEAAKRERRTNIRSTWEAKLSANGRWFPALKSRDTEVYPRGRLASAQRLAEDFEVDAYGNVVKHERHFELSGDKTTADTTFDPNPDNWLIANPTQVKVTGYSGFSGESHVRFQDMVYDDLGLLHFVYRDRDNPSGTAYRQTEIRARDQFGNAEEVVTEVVGEPSRTSLIEYDDEGSPLKVSNALGHTTTLRYDRRWGLLQDAVDPNQHVVQRCYDDFGRLYQVRDPTGTTLVSHSSYTDLAGVASPVLGTTPKMRVHFERHGTEGTAAGFGNYDYDGRGRMVRHTTSGFGGSQVAQERLYDGRGLLSVSTLPYSVGQVSDEIPKERFYYDYLERIQMVENPDGTVRETAYAWKDTLMSGYPQPFHQHEAGTIRLTIDERGKRHLVHFDDQGRPVRTFDDADIPEQEVSSFYHYGPFGELTLASNGWSDDVDGAVQFATDDYGRAISHTDPDSGDRVITYNGFDEIKTATDNSGFTRAFNYDALGRVQTIDDRDGTTTWGYDVGAAAIGRLTSTTSPSTEVNSAGTATQYTYDPLTGLPTDVQYVIEGVSYAAHTDYDDLGRTSLVTYPNTGSGAPIGAQYTYDPSGSLFKLEQIDPAQPGEGPLRTLWEMTSAHLGHMVDTETFGNGAVTSYGYDPERRFLDTVQTTVGAEVAQALQYQHYDNGLVRTRANLGTQQEYEYDGLNRLQKHTSMLPGGTEIKDYIYDRHGSLTFKGGVELTYRGDTSQPHLLKTVGANAYTYNANGNVETRVGPDIPGGAQTFAYTAFDLPRTIQTGAEQTAFDYAADETRVLRRDPTLTRHFVGGVYQRTVDNAELEALEASGSGTRTEHFQTATHEERFRVFAGSRLLGEIVREPGEADETLYFHTDHLGSITAISNDDQEVIRVEPSGPFGEQITTGLELTRTGFTGHQEDRDLGLVDMRGRTYDPLAGRFLQPDPIMQSPFWSQGINRYSYVFNNPLNLIDPSGFEAEQVLEEIIVTGVRRGEASPSPGVGTVVSIANTIMNLGDLLFGDSGGSSTTYNATPSGSVARTKTNLNATAGSQASSGSGVPIGPVCNEGGCIYCNGVGCKYNDRVDKVGVVGEKVGRNEAFWNNQGELLVTVLSLATPQGRITDWVELALRSSAGDGLTTEEVIELGKPAAPRARARATQCFVAGTLVATPHGAIPIEDLRVGDRVETLPGGVETTVDSTWRVIQLTLSDEHEPDHLYHIELLRPPEWLAARQVTGPGDRLFLELEEMGVAGVATVHRIHDAPETEDGAGRVVLMTINHINSDLYEITFEGIKKKLRPTGAHPLYSLDRDAWMPVRDLVIGERLQTAEGAISIAALERIRGDHRVFNIEVEEEHEYLVSDERVRAHNQCVPPKARDVLSTVRETGRAPKGYRGGRPFENDGRQGGQVLPKTDAQGGAVRYQEWDINPYVEGVNRGKERIVTGGGRAWYTSDHYTTFKEILP